MEQAQPMQVGRFLELLNKPTRTEEEEKELQGELLRRAKEEGGEPAATEEKKVEETVTTEPVQAQATEEVKTEVVPAEAVNPADNPVEAVNQEQPYSLAQLRKETQDASDYLKSQNRTIAIDMAIASFTQVSYWLDLALEGK